MAKENHMYQAYTALWQNLRTAGLEIVKEVQHRESAPQYCGLDISGSPSHLRLTRHTAQDSLTEGCFKSFRRNVQEPYAVELSTFVPGKLLPRYLARKLHEIGIERTRIDLCFVIDSEGDIYLGGIIKDNLQQTQVNISNDTLELMSQLQDEIQLYTKDLDFPNMPCSSFPAASERYRTYFFLPPYCTHSLAMPLTKNQARSTLFATLENALSLDEYAAKEIATRMRH